MPSEMAARKDQMMVLISFILVDITPLKYAWIGCDTDPHDLSLLKTQK